MLGVKSYFEISIKKEPKSKTELSGKLKYKLYDRPILIICYVTVKSVISQAYYINYIFERSK